MKRLFSFFAILSLLSVASCMQDPEADFRAPTVSASCTPGSNYGEVTLTIQVSNKHFKDCGFWYGTSSDLSDKKSLPVSGISGQSTGEARLTGLETGITYYYQAYVNSGRTSVTSSILHFTLDDVMNVDTDGFVVSYPETDLQVRVETTLPITVDLGGADWIEEIQTKGLDVYNKVFRISRNTELADRSATIRIASTNGKFKKDIPVQQSGGPITIPDAAFKAYMVEHFDKNGDGEIVVDEAEAVEAIDIISDDIASLQGIEFCSKLKYLRCIGTSWGESYETGPTGKLSYVDITHCTQLEELIVYWNKLTELDVTQCPRLRTLHPARNLLTVLDISNNPELEYLAADYNQIKEIDLSHNPKLKWLCLEVNKLSNLEVSNNAHLLSLVCGGNQIKSIDLSKTREIIELSLQGNPMEQLPDIWSLPLTSLHLSGLVSGQPADFLMHFPNLESVNFCGYDGTTIDLSQNTKLRDVWCCDLTKITTLDLSAAPNLKNLYCSSWAKTLKNVYVHTGVTFDTLEKDEGTTIYYTDGDNHLSISPSAFEVDYKENILTVNVDSNLDFTYDLGDVKWLSFYEQSENTLSFKAARNYTTDDRNASFIIRTGNGQLEKEVKVTQTGGPIEIPDAVFKQYMVDNFDRDRDGEITPAEAAKVTYIDIVTDDIVSLKGLEFCTHLQNLRCSGINEENGVGSGKLIYVDLTHCPELEELRVYHNSLSELDVTQCPRLRELHPACNRLTSLDISQNPELVNFSAYHNQFTEMDLSHNPKLEWVNLGNNKLTRLDFSKCPKLKSLDVPNNQLSSLDLSNCPEFEDLWVYNNRFTTIDVTNNPKLRNLNFGDNQVSQIDLSNNPLLQEFSAYNNKLTSLDLSHNPLISGLHLWGNPLSQLPDIWSLPLSSLHISGLVKGQPADFLTHFPELTSVNFSEFDGPTIDLSQNTKLEEVWCSSMNNIKVLDLSAAPKLRKLYCNTWGANSFSVYLHTDVQLEDFDKDANTKFYYTDGNDHLTVTPSVLEMDYPEAVFTVTVDSNLDVSTDMGGVQWVTPTTIAGQPKGTLAFKVARNYNTKSRTATFSILAGGGKLQKEITVNQSAGPIEIPDAAFKQYMVDNFDRNRDGEITPLEAAAITRIDISSDEIVSLKGIEYCTALSYLACTGSDDKGKLASIDVSHCPDLEELRVFGNVLTELDVSPCLKLKYLHTGTNQLTSLDLSGNPELTLLSADQNLLTTVNLTNCHELQELDLGDNRLKSIDISHCPKIKSLTLQGNPLEQLPDIWSLSLTDLHLSGLVSGQPADFLTHFPNLVTVNFSGFDGTYIDLSKNTKLRDVWCYDLTKMTELDLSAAPELGLLRCTSWSHTLKKVYVHTGVTLVDVKKDDDTEIIYK